MMTINYRRIVNMMAGVAATAVATGLYAWQIEPRWVQNVRRTMPIRHLPPELHGHTLIQLSDLHVGGAMPLSYFINQLKRVQKLQPDFVVYTGDFIAFHDDEEFADLRQVLAHAPQGRLGTAAILGNHDYGRGWNNHAMANKVVACLEEVGIPVLRNEICQFSGLHIAGLDEIWSPNHQPETLMTQLDVANPTILLCHNPDVLDQPIWSNYHGWVLCGHTHGGQIKLPFLPPFFLPTNNKRFVSSEFEVETGQRVYINRGLGHSFPFRFGSRPEVTIFTLETASEA